tara:strand:- start:101 stop:376 length:276 start_codon:yes stop_codon:yes gene_type:complete
MIDYQTKSLMDKARRKKERNKRKQRTLYEKGKKQGGKYTHDINAKGNTVCGTTYRNASPEYRKQLEDAERRKREKILEKIRKMKSQKRRNK